MRDRVDDILEEWSRHWPDADLSPVGITLRVHRLAHLHNEVQQRLFARHGLKPGWLDILFTLRRSEDGRLPATRLAQSVLLSPGGLTGRIDRMQRAGLVERSAHATDRRVVLVSLTARGRRLADEVIAADLQLARELVASLTPSQQRAFESLMRRQIAALEQPAPQS